VSEGLIESFQSDRLNVYVYETRRQLGAALAKAAAAEICRLVAERGRAVGVFTAANSQTEFLDELAGLSFIEWTRVIGFHLNEYVGTSEDNPHSCRRFLLDRLVRRVPMAEFHGIRGEAANPEAVCVNYDALLKYRSPDFAVLGVNEAGRWDLVDPPAADSVDTAAVKIVELDDACRQWQVSGGRFARIEDVPRRAITLTVQAIKNCPGLFVVVSGDGKQNSARALIENMMAKSSAASILQFHPNAHLFLTCEQMS